MDSGVEEALGGRCKLPCANRACHVVRDALKERKPRYYLSMDAFCASNSVGTTRYS